MADLGTSRIFGNLTVTRNIEVKGVITGDGSGLTNIPHEATNFANQNLRTWDKPRFDAVEFNPVANGDLRSSWGTGIAIDDDYPSSGWTTASFSPRSIRGFQLAAGTSYSTSPVLQYRTSHTTFNNGLGDWIKVYTSVDKPTYSELGTITTAMVNFANQNLNDNDRPQFRSLHFQNSEVSTHNWRDGEMYIDLSHGIYLDRNGSPKLQWSSQNVNAGNGIAVTYDSLDSPTISVSGLSHSATNFANQYLNKGSDVLFDRVQAKLGFHGGYNDSNPSAGNWGVPIWSMGSGYDGTGSGSSFSVTSSQYGLVWLRAGHPDASSFADEGVYIYRSGITIAQLGLNGIYFSSETRAPSFKISSDKRLKNKTKQVTKTNTINVYSWEWDNHESIPEQLRKTEDTGVIAQEIENHYPQLVSEGDGGYKAVDYGKLGTIVSIENRERIEKLEDLVNSLQNQSIWSLIKLKAKGWLS